MGNVVEEIDLSSQEYYINAMQGNGCGWSSGQLCSDSSLFRAIDSSVSYSDTRRQTLFLEVYLTNHGHCMVLVCSSNQSKTTVSIEVDLRVAIGKMLLKFANCRS